jgi:hypothetical protein
MPANRFRFRPPHFELTPALLWTLARAYAPPDSPWDVVAPGPRVLAWSRALALSERIASRLPRARTEAEVGGEVAAELWRARANLVARTLLLQRLLEQTAEQASRLDCSLVALKGIALLETEAAPWGGRPMLDLDLLVAASRSNELTTALRGLGMRPSGSDERHHLTPLADPALGELELHLSLPGVSFDGSPITPESLRQADLVTPSARLESLLLPRPELLAAHLIAHALDQHGLSPTAYPVTRLAADLIDLAGAHGRSIGELVAAATPLVARSVSKRELAATTALCNLLAAGADPSSGGADARALLGHTLAAARLPAYRRTLRRRAALRAVGRGDWRKLRPRPGSGAGK